jgi:hypothetical protein
MTEIKPHAAHWGSLDVMEHGLSEQALDAGGAQPFQLLQRFAPHPITGMAFGGPAQAASGGYG